MADATPPHDLSRQARQHLDSLKTSGVEWLPKATPVQRRRRVEPLTHEAVAGASLFAEQPPPPAAEAVPASDQRRHELTLLAERVRGCTRCAELAATRTQTVFGVGPIDPELCIIGEAPGGDEDRLGEPFVGAAGQLLNRILAACGMQRDEVYIANILKCRPPGNRTPRPDEAANCREYLERQLELVRPKFLCAMGGTAAANLLGTTQSLGKLRGRFHDLKGIPVMVTYHPAYLLPHRSPEKKKEVWEDMKMLLVRMGRPIPQPGARPKG